MADTADKPLWYWIVNPNDLINKRCKHCNESMFKDRDSAISYSNEPYHCYCLITFLTKFHKDNQYDSSISAESVWSGNNWGASP